MKKWDSVHTFLFFQLETLVWSGNTRCRYLVFKLLFCPSVDLSSCKLPSCTSSLDGKKGFGFLCFRRDMSVVEVRTDLVSANEFRTESFPSLSPGGVSGRELKVV